MLSEREQNNCYLQMGLYGKHVIQWAYELINTYNSVSKENWGYEDGDMVRLHPVEQFAKLRPLLKNGRTMLDDCEAVFKMDYDGTSFDV